MRLQVSKLPLGVSAISVFDRPTESKYYVRFVGPGDLAIATWSSHNLLEPRETP
jgi:hypothetical protein